MKRPPWKRWLPGLRPQDAEDDAPTVRVLMVCMGNICRSPIAEGVLRERLRQAGLERRVAVDSAGTHGYHTGEPPDPRAILVAARRGYDISGQRARPVATEDFTRFDWMLAMDGHNLAWLEQRAPAGAPARLELLMTHASRQSQLRDLPDPYYGPAAGFEHVLALVEDACEGVVARLQAMSDASDGSADAANGTGRT